MRTRTLIKFMLAVQTPCLMSTQIHAANWLMRQSTEKETAAGRDRTPISMRTKWIYSVNPYSSCNAHVLVSAIRTSLDSHINDFLLSE
ncbi:MAG: hypothetical protein ACN4GM_11265 [Gammaproteobacteria bacterium]